MVQHHNMLIIPKLYTIRPCAGHQIREWLIRIFTGHHLQIEIPTHNKLHQRRIAEHKRTIFSCLKHCQNINERDQQHLPQIDPSNLILPKLAQIDPSNFRNERTPFWSKQRSNNHYKIHKSISQFSPRKITIFTRKTNCINRLITFISNRSF